MNFDPKQHLIKIGRGPGAADYLPVKMRLVWLRNEHPDWSIITSPVEINLEKQYAIFSASILNAEGRIIATGTKMENVKGFPDFMEKAETGSVGRALAMAGYGTQFAGVDLDAATPEVSPAPEGASTSLPPANIREDLKAAKTRFYTRAVELGWHGLSEPNGNGGIRMARIPMIRALEQTLDRSLSAEETNSVSTWEEGLPRLQPPTPMPTEAEGQEPAAPPKPNPLAGNRCTVEGCSNVLTQPQITMSTQKYGRPICLIHQRDPAAVAAAKGEGDRPAQPTQAAPASSPDSSFEDDIRDPFSE